MVELLRCQRGDYLFETRVATQRIPKRDQFQLPVTRAAGAANGSRKLFTREIFVADPSSDYGQVLNHSRAIDRIFFQWQQFDCTSPLVQRFLFSAKSGVD